MPAMCKNTAEIMARPHPWRQVLALASPRPASMRALVERPVAIVGAGASYYVGLAAVSRLERRLAVFARIVAASVYWRCPGKGAPLITRSGATTEALEAARAGREGVPTL